MRIIYTTLALMLIFSKCYADLDQPLILDINNSVSSLESFNVSYGNVHCLTLKGEPTTISGPLKTMPSFTWASNCDYAKDKASVETTIAPNAFGVYCKVSLTNCTPPDPMDNQSTWKCSISTSVSGMRCDIQPSTTPNTYSVSM